MPRDDATTGVCAQEGQQVAAAAVNDKRMAATTRSLFIMGACMVWGKAEKQDRRDHRINPSIIQNACGEINCKAGSGVAKLLGESAIAVILSERESRLPQ